MALEYSKPYNKKAVYSTAPSSDCKLVIAQVLRLNEKIAGALVARPMMYKNTKPIANVMAMNVQTGMLFIDSAAIG